MYADTEDLYPDQRRPTKKEIEVSAALLRGGRDRAINAECAVLEETIPAIHEKRVAEAREILRKIAEKKAKARIDWESETFKAIELGVRNASFDLAIESLETFMEVSRERLGVPPFEEEQNRWEGHGMLAFRRRRVTGSKRCRRLMRTDDPYGQRASTQERSLPSLKEG